MKSLILISFITLITQYLFALPVSKPAMAAVQSVKKVSGVIAHYEPMENSALISLVGGQVIYTIKNLTSFSEEKLAKIFSSMSEGAPVILIIKGENEVVDIQSSLQF